MKQKDEGSTGNNGVAGPNFSFLLTMTYTFYLKHKFLCWVKKTRHDGLSRISSFAKLEPGKGKSISS